MKKKTSLKVLLSLWEGIWGIPASIIAFILFGILAQWFMGRPDEGGPGFYSPELWQAAILAVGELVMFNTAVWIGFYFVFRGIYRYYSGIKKEDGTIFNHSKEDFCKLESWQRIFVLVFLYSFWLLILVMLYRSHV